MTPDKVLQQAQALALEAIAERCKVDLYYLCKQILGYDLMTERTHGELCDYTRSVLPGGIVDNTKGGEAPHHHPIAPEKGAGKRGRGEINPEPSPPTKFLGNDLSSLVQPTKNLEPIEKDLSQPAISDTKKESLVQTKFDDFDPEKKMLLLMMPRGTFKSSVVTIGLALQWLLNDSECRILIDSETYAKAKAFLSEIKSHLEDNEKYRAVYKHIWGVYPDSKKKDPSVRWTDAQIDVASRKLKKKEPSISCGGIDVTKNGMHYDLIICDDLHSELNVTSRDAIEKVIQHWKLALSLLDPDKYMVVIGTRWSFLDMYQYLLDNERHRFNIYIRSAHNSDGSLLFPERLTEKFLREQRQSQGSYIYSCQYENNPIDDETATFKREYFKYTDRDVLPPLNTYLLIDPSFEGEYSDYVGMVEVGMDWERNLYILNVYRFKATYSGIIDRMFELHRMNNYKRIVLEVVATQKSLQYELHNEQKRRGAWLPVVEITSRTKSKEERIRALAPSYEFGRVYHIRGANQIEVYEDELLRFPKGQNDDCIDAAAGIFEVAQPPMGVISEEKKEKKERMLAMLTKPRSRRAGY